MKNSHDFLKGKAKEVLVIKRVQVGPQDSHLKKSFEDCYLKECRRGKGNDFEI